MLLTRQEKIESYYKNKIPNTFLLIDNVHDPHNVAAVMRSADALGIERIYLYYTYNECPNMKKVGKKSSATANKWIITERIKNLEKFAKEKKSLGFKFIATSLDKKARPLTKYKFPEKAIIILGNEHHGISPEIKTIATDFIQIPMVGMVESFNISVAAGIILYEVFKQKGKSLKTRTPQ